MYVSSLLISPAAAAANAGRASLMRQAHALAKSLVEGAYSARLSHALKVCWKALKEPVAQVLVEAAAATGSDQETVEKAVLTIYLSGEVRLGKYERLGRAVLNAHSTKEVAVRQVATWNSETKKRDYDLVSYYEEQRESSQHRYVLLAADIEAGAVYYVKQEGGGRWVVLDEERMELKTVEFADVAHLVCDTATDVVVPTRVSAAFVEQVFAPRRGSAWNGEIYGEAIYLNNQKHRLSVEEKAFLLAERGALGNVAAFGVGKEKVLKASEYEILANGARQLWRGVQKIASGERTLMVMEIVDGERSLYFEKMTLSYNFFWRRVDHLLENGTLVLTEPVTVTWKAAPSSVF